MDEDTLARVQAALEAAHLTDGQPAVMAAILRDERVRGLRDLARHYDLDAWRALVDDAMTREEAALPADVEGDTPAERRTAFAHRLHERAAAAFPTVALAYGLSRREELAGTRAARLLSRVTELDGRFDLATARLDAYVRQHARELAIAEDDRESVTEELRKVQRLYRLKADAAVVSRLLQDGLDSAAAIVGRGKSRFVADYGTHEAFGRDTATAIYEEAETTAARAFALYAHFSPAINTLRGTGVVGDCPPELRALPHYGALFGSLDGCECEPCESVYSPAAYLTDLLAFLKSGVERDDKHPNAARVPAHGLEALDWRTFCDAGGRAVSRVARRPDIAHTLLSCRNAETLVPYVDLVLEILEHAVAPRSTGVPQTTLPADLLAAQPEHFNEAAYRKLAVAFFPLCLPFDLWHEEESICLERLGTSRAELLDALFEFRVGSPAEFPAGDPHDLTEIRRWQSREIARARLNLSESAWMLIAGEPFSPIRPPSDAWGFAFGTNWWHPLRNVDTLLSRNNLEYAELLRLLRLKSFNPTGAIRIRPEDAGSCDTKTVHLEGLDAAALGFLHRLLRLQRALGWTMRELDHALTALSTASQAGRPALDADFLVRLSHLIHLRARFGLPVDEILAWWSALDTADRSVPILAHESAIPSHYERLFLTGRPGEPAYEAFRLNGARTELRTTNSPLPDHLPVIGQALGRTMAEVSALAATIAGVSPTLTLANLSSLYRHSSLARALQLTVVDYLRVRDLVGFDPFASAPLSVGETIGQTVQTLRFVERAELVASSAFSVAELDYILRQTMPFEGRTAAPTEAWAEQALSALEHGLKLSDPFEAVRTLIQQAIDLLGPGPTTTATVSALRSLVLEAIAQTDALEAPADTIALKTALNDAVNLLVPGSPVNYQPVSTKIGQAKTLLDGLTDAFVEQTLRPQVAVDLASVLDLPVPVCAELLKQTPLPADSAVMAGDAFLAALKPAAFAGSAAPAAPARPALVELLFRLHKAGLVIDRLGMAERDLAAVFARGAAAGWLNLKTLPVRGADPTGNPPRPADAAAPFDGCARLVKLIDLRDGLPADQQEHLYGLFDAAAQFQPGVAPHAGPERRAYIDRLTTISGWDRADVEALVGRWDLAEVSHGGGGVLKARFPSQFGDERLPRRVRAARALARRLGVAAAEAASWLTGVPGQSPAFRIDRIRSAIRARYGEAWPALVKPLRDGLRERQRRALVAFLVHDWALERPDDLFDHFLMDVEMSPCMMTSRVVQATASVQLFVERVLMNLEPGLALSDEAAEQWDWMKNYRVWEANRRIFLYPENWIEPELRDDKTPIFEEFEREILQSDLTNEAAEQALLHYLEKLHEIARLQVCGQYLETGNPMVLHVFARTREVPHRYYYRRGEVEYTETSIGMKKIVTPAYGSQWTAWERVDVDIEGDHLIPIVYNRRLHVLWPVFLSEDEAPLTRTLQSVLSILAQLLKLQMTVQQLIQGVFQGIGITLLAGTTNSIIHILRGIEKAINVGGVELVDLLPQRRQVREIRKALLEALGLPASASNDDTAEMVEDASLPDLADLEAIVADIGSLVGSYEQYLLSYLPAKRLEIQLAWSELGHGGWSPKRTSANAVTFRDIVSTLFENLPELPGLGRAGVKRLFTFHARVNAYNQLTVHCRIALPTSLLDPSTYTSGQWLSEPRQIGYFRLNSCSGQLEAVDTGAAMGFLDLFTQATSEMLAVADSTLQALSGDRQLQQRGAPVTPDDDPVRPSALRAALDQFPLPRHYLPPYVVPDDVDPYRILARHQSTSVPAKMVGFFYQDARRSFLCFPRTLPDNNPGKPAHPAGFVFFPFYHPYTCAFLENIQRAGLPGIYEERYDRGPGGRPVPSTAASAQPLQVMLRDETFFGPPEYLPVGNVYNPPDGPRALRPIEDISFSSIGAYAQYNWELFFHIPLLVASRLSTNQKFREAQRWFHYIFDPTDASRGAVPAKYWRTRPFMETSAADYAAQEIDELLQVLNAEAEQPGLQELEWAVRRWRADAFNPHLVARTRTTAFQKTVVMKYIDNLIAWGDALFRRGTRESVNEAMRLYILAAKLLGPRPRRHPKGTPRPERTFTQLEPRLDAMANATVPFENYLPAAGPSLGPGRLPRPLPADHGRYDRAALSRVDLAWRGLVKSPSLQSVATTTGAGDLYFCVPPNDKLLEKWDVVADRLYKIRHCQDIEGRALTLPLLSPPIDPALLDRARAMGVDIDGVLGQIYAPRPHHRFHVMLQKATELCTEVRSLGGALLSALEKRDAEEMSVLRTTHELRLLEAVEGVKEHQIAEAREIVDGLKRQLESAGLRRAHYQRWLAEFINPEEFAHLALGALSLQVQAAQFGAKIVSAAASLVPNVKGGFVTTLGATYGGDNLGSAAERAADGLGHLSSLLSSLGGLISTMGGYRRRAEDWLLQTELATKDQEALARQIAAADIRLAIAESDLENHRLQLRNNRELLEFMQEKFTSGELYGWMVAQVSSLHFQTYQLAYELARQAEMAFTHELGVNAPGIVKAGYWDSLKNGLLAGDHLYHDLKRLDVAYLSQNVREYELTRHVSLLQLDPLALLQLRATGRCLTAVPEALFDMDAPGHYFRRIKAVAVSIPCVTGPYATIHCTLSLVGSSIRRSPSVIPAYPRDLSQPDPRFADDTSRLEAIVTSSGQNDSGLFETSLRDERYLPFEYAGAISEWQLELAANPANGDPTPFDYGTISDVVLHIRYTARDGGHLLRQGALAEVRRLVDQGQAAGSVRLFSIRSEFPSEWARMHAQSPAAGERYELSVDLRPEHYPFWSQGRLNRVAAVDLLARRPQPQPLDVFDRTDRTDTAAKKDSLSADAQMGKLLVGQLANIALPAHPVGRLKLYFNDHDFTDLWMAVTWSA